MLSAENLRSLKCYAKSLAPKSTWVFANTIDGAQKNELLEIESIIDVFTYANQPPLRAYFQTTYERNPKRPSFLPIGNPRRLIFVEIPRLEYLAHYAGFFLLTGISRFIWVSSVGTYSFSLYRLARLYLSIRASSKFRNTTFAWQQRQDRRLLSRLELLSVSSPHTRLNTVSKHEEILLITGTLARGGAERQLVKTAIGLSNLGFSKLTVMCSDLTSSPPQSAYFDDLHNYGVPAVEIPLLGVSLPDNIRYNLDLLIKAFIDHPDLAYLIFKLTHVFWKRRPRVVHAWLDGTNIAAGLAGLITGVPTIVLGCRNVRPRKVGLERAYMAPVYRALAKQANITFVNNSRVGANDYEEWLGLPKQSTILIPNGIDIPVNSFLQYGNSLLESLDLPYCYGSIVGTVGRLADQKRPLLWLRVAKMILAQRPDTIFLVVGSGPLQKQCEALAKRLGINERVFFLGALSNPQRAYAVLDCFLMTSEYEGLPNSLLEAQALGIPVVTSAAGGAPEAILNGTTGLLVPTDAHPITFCAAVLRILKDKQFRVGAKKEGPPFIATNFSQDNMIARTLDTYNDSNCF